MLRLLFIAANLFSVLALRFSESSDRVTLSSEVPEHINKGEVTSGQIIISKSDIRDFGKLIMWLPEGTYLTGAGKAGAKLTFENNRAEWTWDRLPQEDEIRLQFSFAATKDLESVGCSADFVFIAEGNKQEVKYGELVDLPAQESILQEEAQVKLLRELSLSSNEIEVSVTIVKGATSGFARYSDVLPKDMQVENAVTDGASFSVAEGKVRFVWVSVPNKDTLRISYRLKTKGPRKVTLQGEYSYLDGNKTRKKLLEAEVVEMTAEGTAAYPKRTEQKEKKSARTKKQQNEPQAQRPVIAPTTGNLEYRVQIGAFKNKNVTTGRLAKKFGVSENISTQMHEGYFKFMTSGHADYKQARDHRERLKSENGIKSAFVVAYNHGKRITVQEALMISKQKWYK